jgi:hypothetical protein
LERPTNAVDSMDRLARSVEQSMRVEGYPVSHAEALSSAERVLQRYS